MSGPRPVVAVIYAEVTAPVVRAQTPPLLAALRAAGRTVDAALFTSPRALLPGAARAAHRRAVAAFADATGRSPMTRTHLPRDLGLAALGRSLARDLAARRLDDAILFCRQPRAALVAMAARAALGGEPCVVLDLRGLRDAEYLMTLGRSEAALTAEEARRLRDYREQEEAACRGADAVFTVSRPMQRYVADRYGVADAKLGHAPNHADPVDGAEALRDAARARLGLRDGELLVAYCGTLAAWQMPDQSIGLFRAVRSLREDARLMLLTPETAAAEAALVRGGVADAIVTSTPPGDAARVLAAADYGLLLRADDLVNRVACPVKFGEYLACGVRPILSPHIGDQSRAAETSDLGLVVGTASPPDTARIVVHDSRRPGNLDLAGRERRRAWARDHVSPAATSARIAAFLDRVASD